MVLCFLVAIVFVISSASASTRLKKFDHPTKGDGTLNFLVIGDWGRRGTYNQSHVARQVPFLFYLSFVNFINESCD